MVEVAFLMTGALVGLSVAAPVGPMGLLCINRTLSQGMAMGISTGVGASTVHASYCCILLLGLHEVGPWLEGHKHVLGFLSGVMLLAFAWRLLRGRRVQPAGRVTRRSMLAAYGTAVAFNLSNPLSVVLLLAAIAAIVGPTPPSGVDAALLLSGLFIGSVVWWLCLSGAAALLRSRLNARLLGLVNIAAGVVLALSGVLTLVRTAQG